MNDLTDLPPAPKPPAVTSYYGSEQATEEYERAIAEIMERDQVARDEATRIYQTED